MSSTTFEPVFSAEQLSVITVEPLEPNPTPKLENRAYAFSWRSPKGALALLGIHVEENA
jgi:hypothetical protein